MEQGGRRGEVAAADGGRTGADRAEAGDALAALRREWGGAYLVGCDERGWWAAGRVGTGVKRAASPGELGGLLAAEAGAGS